MEMQMSVDNNSHGLQANNGIQAGLGQQAVGQVHGLNNGHGLLANNGIQAGTGQQAHDQANGLDDGLTEGFWRRDYSIQREADSDSNNTLVNITESCGRFSGSKTPVFGSTTHVSGEEKTAKNLHAHAEAEGEGEGELVAELQRECAARAEAIARFKTRSEASVEVFKEKVSGDGEELWRRRWMREKMSQTIRRLIFAKKLPNHAIRNCRVRAIPSKYGDKPTGFSGKIELRHTGENVNQHSYSCRDCCKNMFFCAECAAEFGPKLASAIQTSSQRLLVAGYYCFMVTYTVQHTRESKLSELIDGYSKARRWMISHRQYKNIIHNDLGIIGSFASRECTDDAPDAPKHVLTGFHWHIHELVFYKPKKVSRGIFKGWFTEQFARSIERRLAKLWKKALNQYGLDCSLDRGLRISLPRRKNIDYMEKAGVGTEGVDIESALVAAEYIAKNLKWEMIGSVCATKMGRKSQRISMWEMLQHLTNGNESLIPRFAEYMEAVRGRAFLTWSRGLQAFCGLPDDEAALMNGREADTTVDYSWDNKEFAPVAKFVQATRIKRLANETGKDAGSSISRAMRCIENGYDPTDLTKLKIGWSDELTAIRLIDHEKNIEEALVRMWELSKK